MSITEITPETLCRMLQEQPDLQIVDVRTPEEFYYLGHLPQARLIPLYELPFAFRTLDASQPVVVVCQHGIRSTDACYFLKAQGFDKLYNLAEGMAAWEGPVQRDVSKLEAMIQLGTQGE